MSLDILSAHRSCRSGLGLRTFESGSYALIEVGSARAGQHFAETFASDLGPLASVKFGARECIRVSTLEAGLKSVFKQSLAAETRLVFTAPVAGLSRLHSGVAASHMDIHVTDMKTLFIAMPISVSKCRV